MTYIVNSVESKSTIHRKEYNAQKQATKRLKQGDTEVTITLYRRFLPDERIPVKAKLKVETR